MNSFLRRTPVVALLSVRAMAAQSAPTDTMPIDTLRARDTVAIADSARRVDAPAAASAHGTIRLDRRLVTGLVLGSLAMIPIDRSAEAWFQSPRLQSNPTAHSAAATFNWLGGTGVVAGSVAALALGRLTGNERLSDVGLRTTEAVLVSGAIVGATKGVMGRQRPFLEKNDPADFFVGRGFGNAGLTSFPSGHTAAAFSAATVLSLEAHRSWPRASHVITPLLYGGATAVGLARMYDSKHWASDVALGATVGTLTGIQVMRYNDARPNNRLARILTHTSVAPNGTRGAGVGFSFSMR
jgi:membrane-associated phospholipid phosphatase